MPRPLDSLGEGGDAGRAGGTTMTTVYRKESNVNCTAAILIDSVLHFIFRVPANGGSTQAICRTIWFLFALFVWRPKMWRATIRVCEIYVDNGSTTPNSFKHDMDLCLRWFSVVIFCWTNQHFSRAIRSVSWHFSNRFSAISIKSKNVKRKTKTNKTKKIKYFAHTSQQQHIARLIIIRIICEFIHFNVRWCWWWWWDY